MSEATTETAGTRTWRYATWSGSKATVVASSVEFTPTHVVWRDSEGSVVLAEQANNVGQLSQVGTLGSATRGVRPAGDEWAVRAEDGTACRASEEVARNALSRGYTLGSSQSPIVAALTRPGPDGEWQEFATRTRPGQCATNDQDPDK